MDRAWSPLHETLPTGLCCSCSHVQVVSAWRPSKTTSQPFLPVSTKRNTRWTMWTKWPLHTSCSSSAGTHNTWAVTPPPNRRPSRYLCRTAALLGGLCAPMPRVVSDLSHLHEPWRASQVRGDHGRCCYPPRLSMYAFLLLTSGSSLGACCDQVADVLAMLNPMWTQAFEAMCRASPSTPQATSLCVCVPFPCALWEWLDLSYTRLGSSVRLCPV